LVECPICHTKSNSDDYISYTAKPTTFTTLAKYDKIDEWVKCPSCKKALTVEELILGEEIYGTVK